MGVFPNGKVFPGNFYRSFFFLIFHCFQMKNHLNQIFHNILIIREIIQNPSKARKKIFKICQKCDYITSYVSLKNFQWNKSYLVGISALSFSFFTSSKGIDFANTVHTVAKSKIVIANRNSYKIVISCNFK